jgi:hypothetical protein
MLRKIAIGTTGLVALIGLAAVGLALAAPERMRTQTFGERVASGAATLMMTGIAAGYAARSPDVPEGTTPVIVHVHFRAEGDLETFSARMDGFAPFLSNVPGLVWKVWALDRGTREASGTYLFATAAAADLYVSEILPQGMGDVPYISGLTVHVTPVLTGPSVVTHAVLSAERGA